MGFPADRAGGARKKFWLGLPRSTLQYESHLLSIPKYPEQFRANFLPSMLCVPAPCVTMGRPGGGGSLWGCLRTRFLLA